MTVLEATRWTIGLKMLPPYRINLITLHTVKDSAPSFRLKTSMIATIIINPKPEK